VAAPDAFAIRAIRADDALNKLSLGKPEFAPLKTFLRNRALKFEAGLLARTYVLVASEDAERGGRVWGYVTLVACEVQTTSQNCPEDETGWPTDLAMPAIKLARLAVHKELQGKDLGTQLVGWAMALIIEHVACRVGCRLLVTDAKRGSVGFYEKLGFTMLDTEDNKRRDAPVMFVPLRKLKPAS